MLVSSAMSQHIFCFGKGQGFNSEWFPKYIRIAKKASMDLDAYVQR
jgi:hypothetical protein